MVKDAVGPREKAAPSILSQIWKVPEIRYNEDNREKLLFTAMMGAAKVAAFKEAAAVSNLQTSKKEFDSTKVTDFDSATGIFTLSAGDSTKKESILWGGATPNGVSNTCGQTTSGETDLQVAGFCNSRPCQRCLDVDMHAYVSITAMGGHQANDILNDIWGYSNGGRDYVIIGSNDKAYVVELTDPNNPSHTGVITLSGSAYCWGQTRNVWTDVKVDGHNIYVVSWKQGSSIQVVDGSTFNGFVAPTAATPIATTPYTLTGFTGSHNIQVYNGNLYLFWNSPANGFYACGAGNTGTIIVNTSNMSLRSCISDSIVDVGHDMVCHGYGSTHICFIAKGGTNGGDWTTQFQGYGTVAVNVSNPNSVSLAYAVPNYTNMHFTHQPDLTANGGHMIQTDELDEADIGMSGQIMMRLFLYTCSGSSASLVQTYNTGNNVSDHQGYFSDNYYFLAAYKRGFLGFALNTGSNSMSYKGWMDTWAYSNGRGLVGAWSLFVFPYSACGGNTYYTVVVSDNSGLFIMQPRWKTGNRSCNSKPVEYKGEPATRLSFDGVRKYGTPCRDCLAGEAIKSDPGRIEAIAVQEEISFKEVNGKFEAQPKRGGMKF
jgi:choice-of-anchor B domain-containing protein